MSGLGSGLTSFLILKALPIHNELVLFLSLFLAAITCVACCLAITSDSQDFISDIKEIIYNVRRFQLLRSRQAKIIRNNIRVFLSDRNPQETKCPYNVTGYRKETLLCEVIEIIWRDESNKRIDQILLQTDINI